MDVCVIRVRLCAGDIELLLPCDRHDKYSSWKMKARINLWICAVLFYYLLFVPVYHYFVCLIAISEFQNGSGGWSGGAKVLCIFHHRGVQLILAYSWARPAILVVGKGRGEWFLLFLHFHALSSLSLSFISSISLLSLFSLSLGENKMTLKGWRVVKPQHNQSKPKWIWSFLQSVTHMQL